MAPRKTENNGYAKCWGDKQRALWYVMVSYLVVNALVIIKPTVKIARDCKVNL